MKTEKIDVRVAFMLRPSTCKKLFTLAKRNGRSVSAEVREAIEDRVKGIRVRNDG